MHMKLVRDQEPEGEDDKEEEDSRPEPHLKLMISVNGRSQVRLLRIARLAYVFVACVGIVYQSILRLIPRMITPRASSPTMCVYVIMRCL